MALALIAPGTKGPRTADFIIYHVDADADGNKDWVATETILSGDIGTDGGR